MDGNEFRRPHVPGETFHIAHHFTCLSTNIIYCITCNHCGEVGVGYTEQTLRTRMSRYKSNICRGGPDALGLNEIERHFCEESHRTHHSVGRDSRIRRHGWGHFRVQAIDGIRGADIPPQSPLDLRDRASQRGLPPGGVQQERGSLGVCRTAPAQRIPDLTLAQTLEGGTWRAGRVLARKLRAQENGRPPVQIRSDGSVF